MTQFALFDSQDLYTPTSAAESHLLVRDDAGQYRPAVPDEIYNAARYLAQSAIADRPNMQRPEHAQALCAAMLMGREVEVFGVLALDAQNRLIAYDEPFRGTLAQCSVYPREVLQLLLRRGAAAAIITHCHPSGNLQPSTADKALTRRLREALQLVDIALLDHILVAGGATLSFAQDGLL
ncbi:DNA repair protein [Bordetella ansorpii]|uniref:DNA repair protein n=1 Tax=Bordetella ansorpii TaxID=288768 RepID=A0A157QPC0_9BORD|nr:JAB domain-containing protein [Bordetella ansorpii]SAI46859.1 DNA repair protein [Bordetella ansorpii]